MLIAVPAGPAAARDQLSDLLPAFAGRGVWDLGEDPAASAVLKLTGNFWIARRGGGASEGCNGAHAQLQSFLTENRSIDGLQSNRGRRAVLGAGSSERHQG